MRDWGYAKEYVYAMWLMLQQNQPDDYVIGTGKTFSVRQFVEWAFKMIDIEIIWHGKGLKEVGLCKKTGRTLVKIDPFYYRPTDVNYLCADSSKAFRELGWEAKTNILDLIKIMVSYDIHTITMDILI